MGISNKARWFFLALSLLLLSACHSTSVPATQSINSELTATPLISVSSSVAQPPNPQPGITQTVTGTKKIDEELSWWNKAIFYEIFVRSFYDSNGDGIGDFNGIIEKLDYLNDGDPNTTQDLGITAIWLMPINPSPSYHGYDVTDYYLVNPDYGTKDDFKRLLEACHQRGMRVIIDLVLNHTSIQHPWFIQARDYPSSSRRDWYIWADKNPGYIGPMDEQVWYETKSGYYYAIFWSGMPDLNYKNNAVTKEIYKVARFWLQDMGVDGFRLDAVRYLIEEGQSQASTGFTHQWLKEFYKYYKEINPQAITVGEVWASNIEVVKYVNSDELDMAFNFDLAASTIRSISSWNAGSLRSSLQSSVERLPEGTYATFLTNHDQERVMSVYLEDQDKAKLAANVLLTIPGTPFIYYGEEIGMIGRKPDEKIRTPMLWSDGKNAGFSNVSPWEDINGNYQEINVATEASDSNSILSHYRELLSLRNEHSALLSGEYISVESDNRALLPFLRASEDEILLVVINISKKPVSGYQLSLKQGPLSGNYKLSPIIGEGNYPDLTVNENGGFDSVLVKAEIPAAGLVIIHFIQQ